MYVEEDGGGNGLAHRLRLRGGLTQIADALEPLVYVSDFLFHGEETMTINIVDSSG